MRAGAASKKLRRDCECHEDDQLLLNARKNRRGNKNSATRQSAGCSENRKSREGVVVDEMEELREHAEAQAALFRIGSRTNRFGGSVIPGGKRPLEIREPLFRIR